MANFLSLFLFAQKKMTSERIIRPLISFSNLVQLIAETWRGGVHSDTLITTQTLNHQHLLLDAMYYSLPLFLPLSLSLACSFSPPHPSHPPSLAYYWLISLKDGCLPFRCSLVFFLFAPLLGGSLYTPYLVYIQQEREVRACPTLSKCCCHYGSVLYLPGQRFSFVSLSQQLQCLPFLSLQRQEKKTIFLALLFYWWDGVLCFFYIYFLDSVGVHDHKIADRVLFYLIEYAFLSKKKPFLRASLQALISMLSISQL